MVVQCLNDCKKLGEKYGLKLFWHIESNAFEIASVIEDLENKLSESEARVRKLEKEIEDLKFNYLRTKKLLEISHKIIESKKTIDDIYAKYDMQPPKENK